MTGSLQVLVDADGGETTVGRRGMNVPLVQVAPPSALM
jgi:hypothetical protein